MFLITACIGMVCNMAVEHAKNEGMNAKLDSLVLSFAMECVNQENANLRNRAHQLSNQLKQEVSRE